MDGQHISVTPVTDEHIPAIVELVRAQECRWYRLDPRLRAVRSVEQVTEMLQRHRKMQLPPVVALDAQERVCGYVHPKVWQLHPKDGLRAFFAARNGLVKSLALPDPADPNAFRVATALFSALTRLWSEQQVYGEMMRWPCCDPWMALLLRKQGFLLDSELAYQPVPATLAPRSFPSSVHARLARPEDEEALLALFTEELLFHEPYTPFVRMNSSVECAFRDRLELFWSGKSVEKGAPIVVVIEWDAQIVAMSENDLYTIEAEDESEPHFMPRGRYGHINNVGVRQAFRGQGIGRLLLQASFECFAHLQLDGYILWFNPANPLSSQFWPRMGFSPLWRTYQRHYSERSGLLL
ncbi:GNAT family N-acetyltransferase [Dictyobacter formicarum]|uniref:N-acetyltransferase domain-containing protein n=1 Tax=Dictyobacter formicarum TaxID=2778368 RepID=A0ABQ3VGG8_9CHLR|nr:GNAT family N-acetyltransferase [Dictyobacter formicarum]GHO84816.1 hypothetical protein KSZ_28220 [Dictyobacter formicarum]